MDNLGTFSPGFFHRNKLYFVNFAMYFVEYLICAIYAILKVYVCTCHCGHVYTVCQVPKAGDIKTMQCDFIPWWNFHFPCWKCPYPAHVNNVIEPITQGAVWTNVQMETNLHVILLRR